MEIDLGAMKSNLEVAREASGSELMMVVKANAYGHGLKHVAKAMEGAGVAFFGVANVGEARRIREAGVETRIYLLGPTWAGEREEIVARGWTACVSSVGEAWEFEKLAAAAGKVLKVHLAVDTGMGRGGFVLDELSGVMDRLGEMKHLEIEGLGSHLPSADEDEEFTKGQIARFHEVLEELGGVGRFRYRHLLNSAGLLDYDGGLCNLARPGLMVYGRFPAAWLSGAAEDGDDDEVAGDADPDLAGGARGFVRAAVCDRAADAGGDGGGGVWRRVSAAGFGKRGGGVAGGQALSGIGAGDDGSDHGGRDRGGRCGGGGRGGAFRAESAGGRGGGEGGNDCVGDFHGDHAAGGALLFAGGSGLGVERAAVSGGGGRGSCGPGGSRGGVW